MPAITNIVIIIIDNNNDDKTLMIIMPKVEMPTQFHNTIIIKYLRSDFTVLILYSEWIVNEKINIVEEEKNEIAEWF